MSSYTITYPHWLEPSFMQNAYFANDVPEAMYGILSGSIATHMLHRKSSNAPVSKTASSTRILSK